MGNVNGWEVEDALADAVRIEPVALQEEFVRLPGDLAYWGARYSDAYRAATMAELDRKRVFAKLRLSWRARLQAQGKEGGSGRVTDSMVDAQVEVDDEYQGALLREAEAEVERERTKLALDAVRAKRDMLLGLGGIVRDAMRGDPQVREEQAAQARKAGFGG